MTSENWEIDPLIMCLDDFIVLRKGLGRGGDPEKVKEILGRVVINKTEEEIAKVPLRDLNIALGKALDEVQTLAVPKANATPS